MATYKSTQATAPIASAKGHGLAGNVKAVHWSVSCTAAPTTSDAIQFGYVPKNARVILAVLESTDMDTNGSPSLTINVGDSGDADRLFAASTVGQAGTLSSAIAVAGGGYKYTDKTLITGVAAANAGTGTSGTLYLSLFYVIED